MTSQALPQRAPRPRQGASPQTRSARRPRIRPLVVFVLAVIVAFFGMILSRISLDRTAFELRDLDRQITVQQDRMDELEVEVARLKDPAAIMQAANEMGLVYPETRTPLFVEPRGPAQVVGTVPGASTGGGNP